MATTSIALPDMRKMVRKIVTDDPNTWDKAWSQNITPWDAGDIQPPLREVLTSGEVEFPTSGRALVPGCGSGYDALYIASELNMDTIAIDISPTAVDRASKYVPVGLKAHFEVRDFFSFEVPEDEKFDLIYDYAFFVAIPVSRRQEWGRQMISLLKPGGYLITLVFPLDDETDVGPPWFVRPEHYVEWLGDKWEKVVDRIPTTSSQSHVGRERLIVWRKL
ncbi:S-adenosyl-L-methionine-dependent methyltransferase [Mycena sp. CBHHK59/15]|nr:S-adenosyl-L-methionine-dependent methyltransferase [Mycena sp. CBHHK59/15]